MTLRERMNKIERAVEKANEELKAAPWTFRRALPNAAIFEYGIMLCQEGDTLSPDEVIELCQWLIGQMGGEDA